MEEGGMALHRGETDQNVGGDGELLTRTRSQLVDLAEAAEVLEDQERQQREQEQQGRLVQQLIEMQQQSNMMDVRAVRRGGSSESQPEGRMASLTLL